MSVIQTQVLDLEDLTNGTNESSLIKIKQKIKSKRLFKFLKRSFDVVASFCGIVLLSPFFLVISLAIKLDSKGKVFFKHKRIGKNGKEISIYKFRTMCENAEDMIKDFTPEQQKEFKENYKLKNDPRITKIGNVLRRTSLDELPQLFNIIKGDLSVVGPRPVIGEELEKYGENKDKFLSVTPGLTGYWAANGRSDTPYEQRMAMELYYVDNMSLKLDAQIFKDTVDSVINKRGAI